MGEVQAAPHASTLVQGLREAWAEHRAAAAAEGTGLPQIIYSSRTHSQLAQVMRELRACGYKCAPFRGPALGHAAACLPAHGGWWGGDGLGKQGLPLAAACGRARQPCGPAPLLPPAGRAPRSSPRGSTAA